VRWASPFGDGALRMQRTEELPAAARLAGHGSNTRQRRAATCVMVAAELGTPVSPVSLPEDVKTGRF